MATLQVPVRSEQVSSSKIHVSRGLQRSDRIKRQVIPKFKKTNIKLKFKGSPKKMTLMQVSSKSDPNRKAEGSRSPFSAKVMAKKKSSCYPETTHTNAATPMPPCQGARAGCGITQCEGDSSHSSHHLQQSLGSICLHSHVLRRQS